MELTDTDLTSVFAASYGHRDACEMYKTTTLTTLQISKSHRAARDRWAVPFGQNKKAAQPARPFLLSCFRRDFSA
jgi:hypothetical protein